MNALVTLYASAQRILGKDFISPEEIAEHRRMYYTEEQLEQFEQSLPSMEVLEWCRDNGYMLIAGPNRPMSFLEVRSLNKNYFYLRGSVQNFAEIDKAETRWIMLRKEPVQGSTSKNWSEQQALLSETEVTPNVAEVTWCVTTYKVVRNVYLFPRIFVRTSSLGPDGDRILIGGFGVGGLGVDDFGDDGRIHLIGLSAARK